MGSCSNVKSEVFDHDELKEAVVGNCDNDRQLEWQRGRFGRQFNHFWLSAIVAITSRFCRARYD